MTDPSGPAPTTSSPPDLPAQTGAAGGIRIGRGLRRLADPRSLHWRITATVAAVACAMALGIGILVHRSSETRMMSIGRDKALTALESAEVHTRDDPSVRDDLSELGIYVGEELPDPLRELLASRPGPVTWYDNREPERDPDMWAATRVEGTELAVSVPMIMDVLSLKALDRHMTYAAVAMLTLVVPLTVLSAELVLRRLRRVAGTARRIRHGELDARTASRRHDEIGEISSAVDLMADALQERLHDEQRFTADVAHELRTPLAGLVTSASLLPESEATDLVRDRVQVLRALVEDLLEISRLDAGAEQANAQQVPLGELVTECVRRTGLDTRITVIGHPLAETDPRRLDRIVTNLVLNAHRHGGPPVEITVDTTTIVVRDHGPGFPPGLLAHGPQRFRTGAAERGHGHGLGLTIALGQARVIGARLTLTNAAPNGAIATLELPH
ncbi:sensor histidine kinase [Streptomyces sp. BA2]|uniref:sensor histidine kinase n=1 Tax=Streptomyces sp. BA2 TaxID=436595 RepID=UPI00132347AF|nr:HAMP domain-containing sensor histidine kinase [Streptomyces sp. BA2]MWA07754.1 HAMP domain-containing protein [Streptomyces sp. BA2]